MVFKEREYWAEQFIELMMSEEKVVGIEFDDCTFKGCDFKASDFVGCRFIDCQFVSCDMNVVTFSGCRFESTCFSECKLNGVDWTKVDYSEFIHEAPFSFYASVLDYSSFFGEKLEGLSLRKCRLCEVDFREADLKGADLSETELRGSQFRHSDLSGANFEGATDYQIDLRINTITGARFSRDEALSLLEPLEITLC